MKSDKTEATASYSVILRRYSEESDSDVYSLLATTPTKEEAHDFARKYTGTIYDILILCDTAYVSKIMEIDCDLYVAREDGKTMFVHKKTLKYGGHGWIYAWDSLEARSDNMIEAAINNKMDRASISHALLDLCDIALAEADNSRRAYAENMVGLAREYANEPTEDKLSKLRMLLICMKAVTQYDEYPPKDLYVVKSVRDAVSTITSGEDLYFSFTDTSAYNVPESVAEVLGYDWRTTEGLKSLAHVVRNRITLRKFLLASVKR